MDINESAEKRARATTSNNVGEISSNDGTSSRKSKSSSWGLSTAVHSVGFVAKKVVNNRFTDSLSWHSKKETSTAASSDDQPVDEYHTTKPSSSINVSDIEELINLSNEREKNPSEISKNIDGSSVNQHQGLSATDVIHQSESTKHVKSINQHQRPSSTVWPNKTASSFVDQSRSLKPHVIKPRDGSHVNQHRWPGTINSNALNKGIKKQDEAIKLTPNYASKPAQDSSSDATNISSPSSSHVSNDRLKIDNSNQSSPIEVSPNIEADINPATTELSPTLSFEGDNATIEADPSIEVDPIEVVSPTSIRGVSPPHPHSKGVSHRIRGVIPSLAKPSSTKHFLKSNIVSIFSKMTTDVKKEKNVSNEIEDFKYLELLHNIQVQWQFANATAEAAFDLRRVTAEKSLFDVWKTILELRDSVAAKKLDSVLLILKIKLHAILYGQMTFIDKWASIQREYESALSVTTNDLQARSLSVPITGGVKADIKDLKLVVFSTVQVLQAMTSRIHSSLSKLDKTHLLASDLVNVALHERALLDECEIFLASMTPLQIEECSLRSYLIQSNRTSIKQTMDKCING